MCDGGRFAVPTTLIRPAGLLKNASIFARCSAGHDIHLRLDTDWIQTVRVLAYLMHVVPRSDVYSGIDAEVLSNMGHGFSTPDAKQVHQEDSLPLVSESRDSSRRPDFATQMEVSYFINGYSSR